MESTISRLLECQVHQRGAAGSQGVRRRPGRRHAHALALALPGWEQPAEAELPRVLACASACRRGARQINGARSRRVPLNMKTVFPSPHACIVQWWDASMQPRGTVWQRRAMFAGRNHLPACLLTAFCQGWLAGAARPTRRQQLRPQVVCCGIIFRWLPSDAPTKLLRHTQLNCDMLELSRADRGLTNPGGLSRGL